MSTKLKGLERGDLREAGGPAPQAGERHDSERQHQALVTAMPRTMMSRLTLLATLIATLVVAGSAGINPI